MVLCDGQWSNAESCGYGACKNYTVHLGDMKPKVIDPKWNDCLSVFLQYKTAKESTGIGLSIAKVLTEKMGGNIDAAYSAGYLSIQVIFQEK